MTKNFFDHYSLKNYNRDYIYISVDVSGYLWFLGRLNDLRSKRLLL